MEDLGDDYQIMWRRRMSVWKLMDALATAEITFLSIHRDDKNQP